MPKPPLLGEVASSEAKMTERLYRAAPALFRSLERRPLSNLSVSLTLASSPGRGALGKEVSFSMKRIWFCWKTRRNAKASPTRGGGIERSEDDGEVVQSSTCVISLTRKASFIQPLSLASARQPFPFRHLRATSPGRGSLSWQGSPWQRGFVFDETDLRLLENATECQSLPY